jgi:2'-5' RNA ligase
MSPFYNNIQFINNSPQVTFCQLRIGAILNAAQNSTEKRRFMAEMWRLFIAIELPSEVLSTLTEIQTSLKQAAPSHLVKWVNADGIHLTLKFLGDVSANRRSELEKALVAAAHNHAAFDLATGGLGCFPNTRRPRVIWVGLQQNITALQALHEAVEAHIAPLGFPTEERSFNPHLTLGRVRREASSSDTARLGALVENTTAPETRVWHVDSVSLIRSELKREGAVYTTLHHVPLSS